MDPGGGETGAEELDATAQVASASQIPTIRNASLRHLDGPRDVAVYSQQRRPEGEGDVCQGVEQHPLEKTRLGGGGVGAVAGLSRELGHPVKDFELELRADPFRKAFVVQEIREGATFRSVAAPPDRGEILAENIELDLEARGPTLRIPLLRVFEGETHFFRNAAQFDALYSQVLPQIIERRRALRTLRIWSAGCASGAEPCSIAILLQELLPDVDEWSITILGTDINTEALDRARKAIYSTWAFREQRARQWQSRYFRRKGDRYELVPEVRHMVTFAQLNLARDNYPAYETNTMFMDLILCRNVTIYFTESVTKRVIERLHDALVGGGWLVVGHSEHSLTTYHRFQARNYANAILHDP